MDTPQSILIVNDELFMRNLLLAFLGDKYDCVTASSMSEAMRLMQAKRFDLIITDVLLPDCPGLSLCVYVKAAFPDIPVIVMSGRADEDFIDEARRKGAFDFIPKPFTLGQLHRVIRRALKRVA